MPKKTQDVDQDEVAISAEIDKWAAEWDWQEHHTRTQLDHAIMTLMTTISILNDETGFDAKPGAWASCLLDGDVSGLSQDEAVGAAWVLLRRGMVMLSQARGDKDRNATTYYMMHHAYHTNQDRGNV